MNQKIKWRLRVSFADALVGFVKGNMWGGALCAVIFLLVGRGIWAVVSAAIALTALFVLDSAIYLANSIYARVAWEVIDDTEKRLKEEKAKEKEVAE